MDDIALLGSEYKVIEVSNPLPGTDRQFAYAAVDVDQSIIWLWRETPEHLRETVLEKCRQAASKVHRVHLGAATS